MFRESDGSLILERKGVGADQLVARYTGVDADANRFYYTLHLPQGRFQRVSPSGMGVGSGTELAQWQTASGMSPRLYSREADHLRPGERVRLIAINRASGYLGSLATELKAAGSTGDGRDLSFPVDELVMRPPNLRLWAERQYRVTEGLSKDRSRTYRIGNEGVAEADDTYVVLYGDWLDADGRPLPEGLAAEYGLTGRLAKVVAANQLESEGGQLAHFPIRPGRRTQLIKLPQGQIGNRHFYVQVSGQPHTRAYSFASGGQGALAYRPKRLVPVQVPVADEEATALAVGVYNSRRAAYRAGTLSQAPKAPEPVYRWVYRPEFQFSVYDLKMREIRRQDLQGQVQELLSSPAPVIDPSDALVEIFYGLASSDYPPLTPYSYGGERELVFALGEQEIRATLGADRTLSFDNLEHLGALNPEDYLTLRLYSNNNGSNVLWEWAFGTIALVTDMNRDGRILTRSAGDPNAVVDSKLGKELPFYFWINDDNDVGEINLGGSDGDDTPGSSTPDSAETQLDGIGDLVDWFPVYVDAKGALDAFPSGLYRYRLFQDDQAVAFAETQLLPDSTDPKQRPDAPLKVTGVEAGLNGRLRTVVSSVGAELSWIFLNRIREGKGGIVLVEGLRATDAPLVLRVSERSTGKAVAEAKLDLRLGGVERMYRHINLQNAPGLRGLPVGSAGHVEDPNDPAGYPDAQNEASYLVLVHGYKVSGDAARGWSAEIFKRLYRLGFKGRFVGVTWHGDTGADYHRAVYNAFRTSMVLAQRVRQVTGGPFAIVAHSLGNMVVSNAIAQGGLHPSAYFMLNAAVAIEAYDGEQRFGEDGATRMSTNMTEVDWTDYPPELYSANWHRLFPPGDGRAGLTWIDLFAAIAPVAYNFYSPGEDVLENAVAGESANGSLLDGIGDWWSGRGLGRHAWVTQEIAKGCKNLIMGGLFSNGSVCISCWGRPSH